MRHLILYESSYRSVVEPAKMGNKPHMLQMTCANRVINLATGEILKDRYTSAAGKFLPRVELKELRAKHKYTAIEDIPEHFEEELFKL